MVKVFAVLIYVWNIFKDTLFSFLLNFFNAEHQFDTQ